VQGICDSASGQIGRGLSGPAAANCGSVDNHATWLNITGVAGVFLAVACGALLAHRIEHRPAR
jgi:hypothetical protein